MFSGFWEIAVILLVVLIVFGPSKVPEISRAIGRSMREFHKAMSELEDKIEAEAQAKEHAEPPKATAVVADTAPAQAGLEAPPNEAAPAAVNPPPPESAVQAAATPAPAGTDSHGQTRTRTDEEKRQNPAG